MAEAIEAGAAMTAPQLARRHRRETPYTWGQAMLYVFRGQGFAVFGSYLGVLALVALASFVPVLGGLAGCVGLVFVLAVLMLVPGTLFEIVRTTADGGDELPDWPELVVNFGTRVAEIFAFLVTLVIAAVPLVVLLRLGGCRLSMEPHCWGLLAVGWLLAFLLWVPMFGSIARFHDSWLALRLDLHLAAIARAGADLWIAAALSTVLIVVGQALSVALLFAPVVGTILSAAAGMYGWFTAAHLVGLVFRRHHAPLRQVYER